MMALNGLPKSTEHGAKMSDLQTENDQLRFELAAMMAERSEMLRSIAMLMAQNAEYERKEQAGKPRPIQTGDRVKANDKAGFHKGAEGVVQFVEPLLDYEKTKVWVLRDRSSGPVYYMPYELDVLVKVEDAELDKKENG